MIKITDIELKTTLKKFLYKSGYNYNDIDVEVTTIPDNINEVRITLIPKSDKGIMLLEALKIRECKLIKN